MPNLKDKPAQSSPIPSTYLVMLVDSVTGAVKKMSVAEFLSAEITADTTPPSIVSAYMLNSTKIRVIFSENVPNGAVAGWSSKKNGSANPIIALAGIGTATLDFTLTNPVVSGDTVLISYNPASGNTTDASANEVAIITDRTVVNSLGGAGDITPPGITSMVVPNGSPTNLVVTFNENVPVLTTAGWSFKKLTVNWPISSVSQTSGNVWTFVMSTPAAVGDALLGSYNSTTGNTTDASSNELVTFTDVTVTNNVAGSYDSDAEAYFTAAGITDVPTKEFLDEKIVELKTAGAYAKIEALWIYAGTNFDKFKFNVVNPLDTDAAHRATIVGSVTADANGLSSDGTTGYINFHFNPSTHLTDFNKSGLGYLKRTSDTGGDYANMGVIMGTSRFWHAAPWAGSGWQTEIGNAPPKTAAATANDKRFHAIRSANNVFKAYVDGVAGTAETTTNTASAPNGNVYGMCVNLDGVAYGFAPSGADFVAFWITTDMNDTEAAAFDAVIADMATFFGW